MASTGVEDRLKEGKVINLKCAVDRRIPASWLVGLVAADGSVELKIDVRHATIVGDLDLSCVTFHRPLDMSHCRFTGKVNVAYSTLESYGKFIHCTFDNDFKAHAAHVKSDLEFRMSNFRGPVNMEDLEVEQVLILSGTEFSKHHVAEFGRLRVGKSLECKVEKDVRPARFRGGVRFIDANVGSQAEFDGAQFKKEADFSGLNVQDGAFFRQGVRFGGAAYFRSANFTAQAIFNSATFCGDTSFGSAHFGATALFRSVSFEDDVRFDQMTVGSKATFERVPAKGKTPLGPASRFAKNVWIRGAQFESGANFTDAVFEGPAEIIGAKFCGEAVFKSTTFQLIDVSGSHFTESLTFDGAQFNHDASFKGIHCEHGASFKKAEFKEGADFSYAESSGDLDFIETIFTGPTRFTHSTLKLLSFREALTEKAPEGSRQFKGTLDLVGCTYDRILVAWEEVLKASAPATDACRVDRQPYIQLAKALAAAGDDEAAGCVYYARRSEERKANWKARWFSAWCANSMYWVFARYGVRPWRLVVAALSLIVLGTVIFVHPGAVVFASNGAKLVKPNHLSWPQSFTVTLGRLVPVDLGLGGQWKPSNQGVASAANSALRIAGWLIVPVAVTAVSRAAYRRFVES